MATTTTGSTRAAAHGDWKEALGRIGLVGKGLLYTIIGILAIQLATGDAAQQATNSGAIEWVASQPFGQFLLIALTACLFALAGWRLLDAVVGDPVEGSEASDRAKYAVKGVLYLGLAVSALTATLAAWGQSTGGGQGGGGQTEQQAAATILDWPFGQWLVGALGAVVIGYAVYVAKQQALDAEFTQRITEGKDSLVGRLGRAGYAARSIVFVLIGWFFVQAAITYDPDEAKGLSGTLQELSGEGWGQALLWVVAIGLLAYGLFTLAEARYRRSA
jgi:hypothetical protein